MPPKNWEVRPNLPFQFESTTLDHSGVNLTDSVPGSDVLSFIIDLPASIF
jgi:hypothetical protein